MSKSVFKGFLEFIDKMDEDFFETIGTDVSDEISVEWMRKYEEYQERAKIRMETNECKKQ